MSWICYYFNMRNYCIEKLQVRAQCRKTAGLLDRRHDGLGKWRFKNITHGAILNTHAVWGDFFFGNFEVKYNIFDFYVGRRLSEHEQ